MENLNAIVFLVLGLTSLFLYIKNKESHNDFVLYLLTVASVFLIKENVTSEHGSSQLENVIICFISLNFVLSRFNKVLNFKWNWLIPLCLSASFLFLGKDIFTYNLYDFSFQSLPILSLPILGILAFPLAKMKSGFVSKFLKIEDADALTNVVLLFFIGVFAFIGSFFASNFGIFLIALGYISQSFYRSDNSKNTGIALLFLAFIHHFSQIVSLESVDLSLGKTIEGLFLGVFIVGMLYFVSKAKTYKTASIIVGLTLSFFLLFGLLLLNTQKSDFGGMDAFIGGLIGLAIGINVFPKFKLADMLFCFVISGGLFFGPMIINEEEQAMTQLSVTEKSDNSENTEEVDLFEMKGISLDSILGTYTINEKTVQLTFQLGPKGGVTKGTIKSFSGQIEIKKDLEKSTFDIELPVANLTTFNSGRDESIFEKEYFNLEKFPSMYFSSKQLTKKDDSYELDGQFTMLGVKKPLKVELRYIGMFDSNGKKVPVLIGKSSIDRTQFGMQPDSKEGNIVDFEFKVELIKK